MRTNNTSVINGVIYILFEGIYIIMSLSQERYVGKEYFTHKELAYKKFHKKLCHQIKHIIDVLNVLYYDYNDKGIRNTTFIYDNHTITLFNIIISNSSNYSKEIINKRKLLNDGKYTKIFSDMELDLISEFSVFELDKKEEFLQIYFDKLNWYKVLCTYSHIPTRFFSILTTKYKQPSIFKTIVKTQSLSIDFIERHIDKISHFDLLCNNKIEWTYNSIIKYIELMRKKIYHKHHLYRLDSRCSEFSIFLSDIFCNLDKFINNDIINRYKDEVDKKEFSKYCNHINIFNKYNNILDKSYMLKNNDLPEDIIKALNRDFSWRDIIIYQYENISNDFILNNFEDILRQVDLKFLRKYFNLHSIDISDKIKHINRQENNIFILDI